MERMAQMHSLFQAIGPCEDKDNAEEVYTERRMQGIESFEEKKSSATPVIA